ncbi:MAG: hypothetical protein HUU20_18490 [Pirellulales bacterium]|nr:hypothetical protein [Pirellulales bacterium]
MSDLKVAGTLRRAVRYGTAERACYTGHGRICRKTDFNPFEEERNEFRFTIGQA